MKKVMLPLFAMLAIGFLAGCNKTPTEPVEPVTTGTEVVQYPVEDFAEPSPDAATCSTEGEQGCEVSPELTTVIENTTNELGIIGKTVEEAEAILKEKGMTLRVAQEDGKDLPITMDLVEGRVNVIVKNNIVESIMNIEEFAPVKDELGILEKTVEEAEKILSEKGMTLRVVEEDGNALPITMDLRDGRVNVIVENKKVVSITNIEKLENMPAIVE